MMAKMFYRFDEARQVLGMTDEQLRQLTREGKLREFRDGTTIMFKADQVDQLKAEMGLGGDNVDLGPSDTGGPIGLADSRNESSSGSVISLADSTSKEDTAADLSLTGSGSGAGTGMAMTPGGTKSGTGSGIGLASSSTGTGIGLAGTGAGGTGIGMASNTGSGVSVLGLDEGGSADANAATAMGGSFGGEPNLEAMGSGSGLLDLSRERDDTSLGAPVLDEITAGGTRGGPSGAISGTPISAGVATAARAGAMPVYVEEPSNFAGFAAGASAIAALLAVLGIWSVAAGAMGAKPTFLSFIQKADGTSQPFLYLFGAGLIAAIIVGLIGFLVGKKR